MAKIRLLSENVANMIAAGEVVERPASVVKELVENSLDAGATRVLIDARVGGRKLIRVVDDGEGMSPDDAMLALERHATSKIATEKDLFSVGSLGFRGEALPAIASVSRMTLRTARRDADRGFRIHVQGGTVMDSGEDGTPPGTEIEIEDLFFNTPGRRKFLRSPETELTHIVETVTRLALPRRGVFFRLRHDDKALLQVPDTADLPQRVAALLGRDASAGLVEFGFESPHVRLSGFLSGPETTRSSANYFFVYCNGRFLRDRVITHAINTGYRGHVLKGRYPIVVMMIEIAPELVDVNVHPTKSEVRFRKPAGVYDSIVTAIDKTLRERFGAPDTPFGATIQRTAGNEITVAAPETGAAPAAEHQRRVEEAALRFTTAHTGALFGDGARPSTDEREVEQRILERDASGLGHADMDMPDRHGTFARLAIVGQVFDNYIVCETRDHGGTMVMIDAHAAHERILFERLKRDYERSAIAVQTQLLPVALELRRAEAAALEKMLTELKRAGIDVEPFGGDTYRITATPSILSPGEAEAVVRECIERVMETGAPAPTDKIPDRFLSVVACHSAVRSGQELTIAQMREILRGLDGIRGPGSCPHGRPTFWYIPLLEIEKRFKRK
ncbi:MAG: DNA mismatch repair endonuclease MutL [Deltaproteobacteria bacterium]|nr:DNA mismatch repair endonuclease MutL [Deltaproteobacteria bacterium]